MARFFLALFAFVLFAAVANASIEDNTVEITPEEEEEYRRGLVTSVLKVLAKTLGKEFVDRINMECVYEVTGECGFNIFGKHLYQCAEAYIKQNKERCLK